MFARRITGVLALLINEFTYGFLITKRKQPSQRSGESQSGDGRVEVGSWDTPTSGHLSSSCNDPLQRHRTPGKVLRPEEGSLVKLKIGNGLVTQLGGWRHTRTALFSYLQGEGDSSLSGESASTTPPTSSNANSGHRNARDRSPATAATGSISGSVSAPVSVGYEDLKSGAGDEDPEGSGDSSEGDELVENGNYTAKPMYADEFSRFAREKPSKIAAGTAPNVVASHEEGSDRAEGKGITVAPTATRKGYDVVCEGGVCHMKSTGEVKKSDETVIPAVSTAAREQSIAAAENAEKHLLENEIPHGNLSPEGCVSDKGSGDQTAEQAVDADTNEAEADSPLDSTPATEDDDVGVKQLVDMGWDQEESTIALAEAGGDVLVAAEALAAREEDDLERFDEGLRELKKRGWDEDVAMSAMRAAHGNSTAALLSLEEEDRMLSMQFEQSIEEMVRHGWDEEVARKALLMQWQKDIEGRGGGRKVQKQFEKAVQGVRAKDTAPEPQGGQSEKDEPSDPGSPQRRISENIIVEVTSSNFHKMVMECPVPVLLYAYQTSCSACKTATPKLEELATARSGAFRLAKLDVMTQPATANALRVGYLPAFYHVRDGVFLDNFVGISKSNVLMLDGILTGTQPSPERKLADSELSRIQLRDLTRKVAHVTGNHVLGSRKREKLSLKVDEALSQMMDFSLPDGTPAADDAPSVAAAKKATGVLTTILTSPYRHIEDPKFRRISTKSKVYREVLSPFPAVLEVMRLAGFRYQNGDTDHLALLHRNMAVLALVKDRVEAWRKKVHMPEYHGSDEGEYDSEEGDERGAPLSDTRPEDGAKRALPPMLKLEITVRSTEQEEEKVIAVEMPPDSTMGQVFDILEEQGLGREEEFVVTTAFPKKKFSSLDGSIRESTLCSLGLTTSARLTATKTLAGEDQDADADVEAEAARRDAQRKKMLDKTSVERRKDEKKKKAGSLFGADDGIIEAKKGKHAEYFGGDSTVTVAATDDDDDGQIDGDAERVEIPSEQDEEATDDSSSLQDYDDLDNSGDSENLYDSEYTDYEGLDVESTAARGVIEGFTDERVMFDVASDEVNGALQNVENLMEEYRGDIDDGDLEDSIDEELDASDSYDEDVTSEGSGEDGGVEDLDLDSDEETDANDEHEGVAGEILQDDDNGRVDSYVDESASSYDDELYDEESSDRGLDEEMRRRR